MKIGLPLRILLVQCEFTTWQRARHWAYIWHLGIEEGLAANGVEFMTLATPWISRMKEICAGRQFDQVWINDIAHLGDSDNGGVSESDLAWLTSLAPICVGFLIESIDYSPEDYAVFPSLKMRRQAIERHLKYFTHIVTTDEKDASNISVSFKGQAIWLGLTPIPERYICKKISTTPTNRIIYSGAPYGERAKWLEHPDLKNLIIHQESPDNYTLYPTFFNVLPGHCFRRLFQRLIRNRVPPAYIYPVYLRLLRHIRRHSFWMYLKGLQEECAVVNLPSLGKVYTSRVPEGMATGRPVIAWEVPDRPMTKALFNDGEEILLFSNPEQLAAHIQHILSDPKLGNQIAENALNKIRKFHTVENRVRQILNWVETGEAPTYF